MKRKVDNMTLLKKLNKKITEKRNRKMEEKKEQQEAQIRKLQEGKRYIVLQIMLREALVGTGAWNTFELENAINEQANRGFRLVNVTTTVVHSRGIFGGDRIQAIATFEKEGE